jgi:hypothetical protein
MSVVDLVDGNDSSSEAQSSSLLLLFDHLTDM